MEVVVDDETDDCKEGGAVGGVDWFVVLVTFFVVAGGEV